MASILDILGWRNISASVQKVETGVTNRLPPAFTTTTEDVLGDRTSYVTFRGERRTARRGEYASPSRARTLRPVGEQSVTLLHFPEHFKLRQELVLRLRNPNDLLAQTLAQKEIARYGADFRTLFDNTRVVGITMMLSKGKIWFDANGDILPTASGADLTIDYSVPSTNTGQLNFGSGNTIDASWATASTNIIQHLENIRIQMKRTTGRDLKHAFYGANIAAYLFKNDTLKSYWQFNPAMYQQFASAPGMVPQGFAGLQWHPMGDAFFADNSDSLPDVTNLIWDADQVTFTPEVDRNLYTLFEGSIAVPKSFGIAATADGAMDNFEVVYGMGGYAVPEVDPVGVKTVMFDTFFPAWKVPQDLYIADVTP